jgi:hypothetical protein
MGSLLPEQSVAVAGSLNDSQFTVSWAGPPVMTTSKSPILARKIALSQNLPGNLIICAPPRDVRGRNNASGQPVGTLMVHQ